MNKTIFVAAILAVLSSSLFSQAFVKQSTMAPMRDGTMLAADIYRPNDDLQHPVILYRTPYNKNTDGFSDQIIRVLNTLGYVYIAQDCRGRYNSAGVDSVFLNDGWGKLQDGYDTIEWIVQQRWCNGKVAQLGGSATGITTLRAAAALHPNLTCAAALVAPSDFYSQVVYPGGEYRKSLIENWVNGQGSGYMISYFLEFPYYNDLWEQMNLHSRTSMMTTPILHMGGWYDCFSEGSVNIYQDLAEQPNAGMQKIIMGPWVHGQLSDDDVGELDYPESRFDWEGLLLQWLGHWLRGFPASMDNLANVHYYLMGDPDATDEMGCQWIDADTWPPPSQISKPFYLAQTGELQQTPPFSSAESNFAFDPTNPVPTLGGNNLTIKAGPYDQRATGQRDDVLSFISDELAAPVRVEGVVHGQMFISSDRLDTDFTLKLIDVYPDGREMLVTDGIKRACFRDGFREDQIRLLTPGEITAIDIELPPTAIVFNTGHRIKVDISSSNYPRYEVNPNTGNAPNDRTSPQIASNTIHIGGDYASRISLPVIPVMTGITKKTQIPIKHALAANYPNPFNAATIIEYTVSSPQHVVLEIYDSLGRHVNTLLDAAQNSGVHRLVWEGIDKKGVPVPSGVYVYQLRAGHFVSSRKMLLVK
jgi:uncharacterized protein